MTTRTAQFAAALVTMLTAGNTWAQEPEAAPPDLDVTDDTVTEEEPEEEAPAVVAAPEQAPRKDDEERKRKPREREIEAEPNPPWYRAPAYACPGCTDGELPPSRRIKYHESMQVPDGYHLESTPRWGLIGAGIAVTGTLWGASVISAIALDKEASQEGDPNFDDMYWPMFIPVIGPFATIGTADSSGTGAAILALDGAIQAAGIAMVIGGFAAPTVEIVEDYKINITPVASKDESGLNVSGTF